MANEITISASLAFAKGNANVEMSKGSLSVTVTGTQYIRNIQSVATSEEALVVGEVPGASSPGYCYIRNNDATNFVEMRSGTGIADFLKLKAGEVALFRFAADMTAPFVIADTAAVEIEYLLIEE